MVASNSILRTVMKYHTGLKRYFFLVLIKSYFGRDRSCFLNSHSDGVCKGSVVGTINCISQSC